MVANRNKMVRNKKMYVFFTKQYCLFSFGYPLKFLCPVTRVENC